MALKIKKKNGNKKGTSSYVVIKSFGVLRIPALKSI
jgi:hypothetical protein